MYQKIYKKEKKNVEKTGKNIKTDFIRYIGQKQKNKKK